MRALGGILDAARFDMGPAWPSANTARWEARAAVDRLEQLAGQFREDRRLAAGYGLTAPSQAPATVAVLALD